MVPVVEGAGWAHHSPMIRFVPLGFLLTLGACVAASGSVQTVDGKALRVTLVEDFYWASSIPGHPEVEVFPLVTALVVSPVSGGSLTQGDEAAARAAVTAHCAALGVEDYDPSSNFSDDGWAFSPC
jgi:hypothetical protein